MAISILLVLDSEGMAEPYLPSNIKDCSQLKPIKSFIDDIGIDLSANIYYEQFRNIWHRCEEVFANWLNISSESSNCLSKVLETYRYWFYIYVLLHVSDELN